MQANHGQIQIPLPSITDDPRWIGRFSRDVRKSIAALRDRKVSITGQNIRFSGGTAACSFGSIITVDDGTYTKAISGGAFLCGDKNFNVPYRGINLGASGSWLVQITLTGIDPSTDDDNQVFLSGVITASGTPSWGTVAYTGSENYTPNTNPATPTSTGTIVIPIGLLVVASGAATLTSVGCGTIEATQCGGILTHTRG
jgi:hypothetical protein